MLKFLVFATVTVLRGNNVFIIYLRFCLAQHFSCSVKTVECGQIFILSCRQLRKKDSA